MSFFTSGAVYRFLLARWWLAVGLMGVSFLLFGASSMNLARVFIAAWDFFVEYGMDAVRDGVLVQFWELLVSSYAACAFYVVFKLCGQVLVDCISGKKESGS